MQTITKNPLSLKTQNQEPFANGSNNVGGGVTSLLYDSKKALKLVNDMSAYGYPTSFFSLIIEDIENHLLSSDNDWIIKRLVDDLSFEERTFKSYKRKLKKLGFETLEKHELILSKCCVA